MADGFWSGPNFAESLQQSKLIRHRLLLVWTGASPTPTQPGLVSDDPNLADSPDYGPHFIMSPDTPDGKPTLGFEFALMSFGISGGAGAVAAAGGFTVTAWELISSIQRPTGLSGAGVYANLAPVTGVAYRQLYRSFDVNATAIRFQITNVAVAGKLFIAFTEL